MNSTGKNAKQYYSKNWFYLSFMEYAEVYFHKNINLEYIKSIFNEEILKEAIEGFLKDIDKLDQVLSYGSTWDEDEFLYIFTQRISLYFIDKLIKDLKIETSANFKDIDFMIKSSNTKNNTKNIKIAQSLILKNWKELDKKWISYFLDSILVMGKFGE